MQSRDNLVLLARELLDRFEHEPATPEGMRRLVDGLSLLSDAADSAGTERERQRARNLFASHARKAQERARDLLREFNAIPDETVEHWHSVMREFEEIPELLPESFRLTLFDLVRRLVRRYFEQMRPRQREVFLREELRKTAGWQGGAHLIGEPSIR